ncbi:MAG: hypothetical protein P8X55_03560 [Desulfosarcinaceae bacterium]
MPESLFGPLAGYRTDPESCLIFPYLEDMVLRVECWSTWYWAENFRDDHRIPLVSGHALYMGAIAEMKTKKDKPGSYQSDIFGLLHIYLFSARIST